jgi:hypothetical protein
MPAGADGRNEAARHHDFNIQPEDGSADGLVHNAAVERSDTGAHASARILVFSRDV